jgi:hypothetical protein
MVRNGTCPFDDSTAREGVANHDHDNEVKFEEGRKMETDLPGKF